jgi:hypothetical protein
MASGLDANTTSHMILALVIALCSGDGSSDCGGSRVALCCSSCMVWQLWSHGLTVAVAVVVMSRRWQWSCRIVLWWLHGVVVTVMVAWLDDGYGR